MKSFKRFTQEERDKIAVYINREKSIRKIAELLDRSPSSISREIKRNARTRHHYRPHRAHQKAQIRQYQSHKRVKLKNHALRIEVERLLQLGWSPEIIAGWLKMDPQLPAVSHETIYQWIYDQAPHLIHYLVRSHPTRWPKGKRGRGRSRTIPYRVSIQDRPENVRLRSQPGHWETDQMVGRGSTVLQVVVERQSRFTRIKKVHGKTSLVSRLALSGMLKPLPPHLRRSITYDNGPENYEHYLLNRDLGTDSYFCAPYHSWEKGTVENTNGLIRRFWPKRTNFDKLSDQDILKVESWLNHRPRKCLKFKTPAESFNSTVALAG